MIGVILLKFNEMITAVDTHTGGEPTRIILSGLPRLYGKTVKEKRDYFKENFDYIRKRLTYEPRGFAGMLCAALVPPEDDRADYGVFYFDDVQYLDMCGHATIGVGNALAELGLVHPDKAANITLETPAGLVRVENEIDDGQVISTSIYNVDSYVVENDIEIDLEEVGKIKVDVAYGGNYFAIVDATNFNIEIVPENIRKIKEWSKIIRKVTDEELKDRNIRINLVQWFHPSNREGIDTKCIHSSGSGAPDRSPGGTGTSAKLAVLYSKGLLDINEEFVQEGVVGGVFVSKITEIRKDKNIDYISTKITSNAYITAFHKFVFDSRDYLRDGFFIE